MFKKSRHVELGVTKRTTSEIVNEAVERQLAWRAIKRKFGLSLIRRKRPVIQKNIATNKKAAVAVSPVASKKSNKIKSYWFPILCAAAVVMLVVWAVIVPNNSDHKSISPVPEPISKEVVSIIKEVIVPSFDIVRIEQGGRLIVAGRWLPHTNVSVIVNGKLVATELTNDNGEFVYSPIKEYPAGNYTIRLLGVEQEIKSTEDVFVYIAPLENKEGSLSLLMTKDGSRLLQSPTVLDGDLVVTKIDYLSSGRIVVQGNALPRLRVSLVLNELELGFARVSDHKNFALGANVGELQPGQEYSLSVRMHDGEGNLIAKFDHKFVMPSATGSDDTYYTVRRDDALWIIARNFLGRGIKFSMIVDANKIKNPNLIFPKQVLKIPVSEK